jgi:hypothetical protein
MMNVEGGDGSTLSLDFTTGVLDPRLSFTRSTNATFINSQGLVQYAAANEFLNTAWITSTTPTGWNTGFGTGTTTWNNNGTVTMDTGPSSTRPMINASSMTVAIGIPHTFGYRVVSVSGSPTVNNVIHSTVAGETYAINGVTQPSSTVVVAGDIVSCTFTPTASPVAPRMGPGSQAGMTNTSMTITQPQMNRGTTLQPYLVNSSTSVGNFNAPRFDYDPTTTPPTPRGLLIEGSANNLCLNSQALTTGWGNANMITPTNPAITDPFGGTSATWKLVAASGSALHSWRHPVITLTAAAHTFSFWAKADVYDRVIFSDPGSGIGACTFVLTGNGTATVVGGATNPLITRYPNGWYRCSVTITTLATTYAFGIAGYPSSGATLNNFGANYTANGTDGAYATGLQIELGSGASSYIPTGASTGNRAADYCTMPTSSFITGNPYPNTLFVDCIPTTANSGFPNLASLFDRTGGGTFSYGNQIYYYNAATMSVNRKVSASTNSDRTLATGLAYNTRHKFATSISSASFIGSRDGVTDTGATTAPSALSSAVTHFGIGCNGDSTASAVMNGWLRQIKFWPTNLSQATINSITTL